jgi:hypothetical protein
LVYFLSTHQYDHPGDLTKQPPKSPFSGNMYREKCAILYLFDLKDDIKDVNLWLQDVKES